MKHIKLFEENYNYSEDQLRKLKIDSELYTIQIRDFEGNKTNFMGLNKESRDGIIKFLNSLDLKD